MKNFCSSILILVMSLVGGTLVNAQCILWDTENLQALKTDTESDLFKNSVGLGEWFATQVPTCVTRKVHSISGDSHNYESLSLYCWPDTANPEGPWIMRPGFINQQYKEYDFDQLLHLQNVVRHFAIAYYLTGKETFHEAATRWLRTWFVDPDTYMYPQMEFSQVRPGDYGNRGTCWGIIEAYTIIDLLEGYQLINSIKPFDKDTDSKIHTWVKDFTHWLINSELGKMESTMEDMHAVAYDVILYYFASFNKDKKLMKTISNRFAKERLVKQIDKNGMMPFEMNGRRVFHDHLYNLQHIIDFCIMQKHMGKNFYAQNQKIIDSVFDFMLPYMKTPETFPYTQVSDWDVDISDFKIELMRMSRLNSRYSRDRIGYGVDPFETEVTVVK